MLGNWPNDTKIWQIFVSMCHPDQMFHILVQACLTEKQFIFGFNRKTIFFVVFDSLKLRSTLFDSLKLRLTNFSGHKNVKHLVGTTSRMGFVKLSSIFIANEPDSLHNT